MFVNGLPLAVIELKNPANEQADIWEAFNQLQTYKDEIADLFIFNEALVVSDGLHARVGSLTADAERFMPWRTIAQRERQAAAASSSWRTWCAASSAPSCFWTTCAISSLFEQDDGSIDQEDRGLSPVPRGARGGARHGDRRAARRQGQRDGARGTRPPMARR
ncbi:MAG: type I restriction endonuclease [Gemmatimonadaceae bacterium]|nr:type I restriction endonuclease [Gemmatimonadaceae bacterium]